jgi:hypothetical protein
MPLDLQPGIYPEISEQVYHADQLCATPTLSCSIAKVLINQSPLHAWCEHPRLGNKRNHEPTPEQERGSASHKLSLGKGAEIAVGDWPTWQAKDARAFRDAARAEGKIPILKHKMAEVEEQRDEFVGQLSNYVLLSQFNAAQPEVVVVYSDGGVLCRAMFDKLYIDEDAKRAVIFDIKTTESVNPKNLGRLIFNQHYDMQESSYRSALSLVRPDLAGRIDFIFLFQETEYPYILQPATISGESRTLGVSKWTRAWQMWSECLKAGKWPAYSKQIVCAEAPEWALSAELGSSPILP